MLEGFHCPILIMILVSPKKNSSIIIIQGSINSFYFVL